MRSIHITLLAASCILVSSCDSPKSPRAAGQTEDTPSADEISTDFSSEFDNSLAQFAYPRIRIERESDESRGQFLRRSLDLQLLAFRQRGLKYWRENGVDTTIAEWFAVTTALPPSNPPEATNRVQHDTETVSLSATTAQLRRGSWDADQYEIFLVLSGDPAIPNELKFFIESNLFMRRLDRARAVFVSSGQRSEYDAFLDDVLNFFSRYPSADSAASSRAGNDEAYLWSFIKILRAALGRRDVFDVSYDDRRRFVEGMERAESDAASILAADMRRNDFAFTFHPFYDRHRAFEEQLLSGDSEGWFSYFNSTLTSDRSVDEWLYQTPMYPSVDQPQNDIEFGVLNYNNYVGAIEILSAGVENWDDLRKEQKVDWLTTVGIFGGPNFFPKDELAYFVGGARSVRNLDLEELAYWTDQLVRLTDELVQDSGASLQNKQSLEILLARRLFRAGSLVAQTSDLPNRYVAQLLERLDSIVFRAESVEEFRDAVAAQVSSLWRYRDDLGLSDAEVRAFVAELPESNAAAVQETVSSILNPVELMPGAAVNVEARTFDGDFFQTRSLAGSIVLVDHWDTNCAPCIAAMPILHEVYERYKARGVEVVSIAYDGTSQRSRVERIKEESGLTWITLNGEGLWPAIAAQYGYRGVPQYMLLDRDGRWYAGTEEMGNGANFEALLNEMLAAEAVEKEASTVH